jgi:D-3-phosphoglycerate dehydrogenase
MYNIKLYNKVSEQGLKLLDNNKYSVSEEETNPDAILLRSFSLHDIELPQNLKAIARAGAGVNNIPVDKCSEKGIVVFNTPGANANAVKELTIAALLLSSRKIAQGIEWVKSLKGEGDKIPKLVEKGKSNFVGPEIKGKKLGVIGLGAIGVMVANAAQSLGMEVEGFDPYISVDAAWALSRGVHKAESFEELLQTSDYITIHVPVTDETKHMIDKENLSLMKKGVRILNFSRGELINDDDLLKAINEGIVSAYVTDFPNEKLMGYEEVILIPHLGASTPESEENCAVMAVSQVKDFLENGNIVNSVNFPTCEMSRSANCRITFAHKNIPNMVGQITAILAKRKINIANMVNKSRKNVAYTIIDIEEKINGYVMKEFSEIDGMLKVRFFC